MTNDLFCNWEIHLYHGRANAIRPYIIREIQKSLKCVIQNRVVGGIFILKPDGENDLTAMNAIVSINREIHLYHGRANAIRPYYHP